LGISLPAGWFSDAQHHLVYPHFLDLYPLPLVLCGEDPKGLSKNSTSLRETFLLVLVTASEESQDQVTYTFSPSGKPIIIE
jgi:hypothetical protein